MLYAYIRVSSRTQNIDRQLEEIKNFNVETKNIFIDYQSGKDFNRVNYIKMIKRIRKNDLLIIKSIDRLGRNYTMITEEWQKITKKIGANILVIDMPLLDTRNNNDNLINKFINDLVLQLLSFVAENERINIKERQAEGIKIAKEKGVVFGRPKIQLPLNTPNIIKKYKDKQINSYEASKILGISRCTFYRLLKDYQI